MSDAIRTRIDLLRSRARGAEIARSSGRLAIILVVGLLGWLACDYWLVTTIFGLGWWDIAARLALTGTLLWLLGREAWGGLAAEIRRHRADDELAMRLEESHPELGGRLISTVQLMRDLEAGETRKIGSPGLVMALAEDAQARAESVDHRLAWDLRPAKSAMSWAAALLAIGIGLAAWRGDIAAAFLRRLAFMSAHYPTATRILSVTIPELVGRGDPVPVEVEVDPSSEVPEWATASVRGADGRSSTIRLERVEVAGKAVFRGSLKQAVEEVAMRPSAGDHRWESWVAVRVLPRPAVKSLSLRLVFPEYLKQAPQVSETGDLQVPTGTVVEVTAALSRTVTEAVLQSAIGLGDPTQVAMEIGGQAQSATGRFTVTEDGWWSISLKSADGLDSGNPPRWTIAAIPDRAPSVVATFPAREKDATRFARWPIRFVARDDHGVAGVRLRWQIIPPGADPDSVTAVAEGIEVPNIRTSGSESTQGEVGFDLGAVNPEVGSRVIWWLEVRDARTPQANVSPSQRGTFNIMDPAEMRERMIRDKAELVDSIKTIRDRQRDTRDGVDGARKAVQPGQK
ncbi:MAG: hypothetical protein J0M02_12390 [Planctomycetes bacterium]|nr:hypothetical protein [Planctomycetota bacterium]